MAAQRKADFFNSIQVRDRKGGRGGRFEITSGGVDYYRYDAKTPTLQLTLQQLIDVLEGEIEYRDIDAHGKLPKGLKHDVDFRFEVTETEGDGSHMPIAAGSAVLSRQDEKRANEGGYDFDAGNGEGRRSKKWWTAFVSIPMCMTILAWYIDRALSGRKVTKGHDKTVVVTKPEMRTYLLQMLKRLD